MSGIELSSAVWVDPLVAACVLAALYAPLKDFFMRLTKKHKVREAKMEQLLNDWSGEEARPGIEARPGVMLRLQNIEKSQAITDAKVSIIEHEVNFNSGTSIKDAVHRVDKRTAELDTKLTAHLESQRN